MKRVPFALAVTLLALSTIAINARSQTAPLPVGQVQNQGTPGPCLGNGWVATTCIQATMHCDPSLSVDDMIFTYGYSAPTGTYLGTVVTFSGGGGTMPGTSMGGEVPALQAYLADGFEIVQVQWNSDWEAARFAYPPLQPYGNILNAACRPAGLLAFVYNSTAANNANPVLYNPSGGMCAHGFSGGSAAVVYALSWYGAGWGSTGYIDNVELLSGPVTSRVDYGCKVPTAPYLNNICSGTSPVCNRASNVNPWSAPQEYVGGWENYPRQWSNIYACANSNAADTTPWNGIWHGMSIINPSVTAQQLSYPSTSAKAWLCGDVYGADEPLNNSSSQGWLFYTQPGVGFMSGWSVNAVTKCNGAEGVLGEHAIGPDGDTGLNDVTKDMKTQCVRRLH